MKTAQMLFIAAAIYGAAGKSKEDYICSGILYILCAIAMVFGV